MSKTKILVIPSDLYGIGHFRFIEPHIEIQKQFPDEFEIVINNQIDIKDINYLSSFNIVFGNKDMCSVDDAKVTFSKLKSLGTKVIIDIDDYWELSPNHPHYQYAKQIKLAERITGILKEADYVTTTTDVFADDIKNFNKNVLVFPNAIDPTSKKFQIKEVPSEKVRIAWLGGSSHLHDIKLLKPMFDSINQKYQGKIQTVLCGFDTRGKVQETDQNGQTREREITPKETCWYEYEKIFTSDYKYLSPEYKTFLMKFKNEEYPHVDKEQYRRVWTKPMSTYSLNYNLFDISLAPLEVNKFNKSKSQLKIIESGFFKKAVIASEISPYEIDIKDGINGFLVKNNSGTKNWNYHINNLINNPNLRNDMGEKLYETVKDKYDIRKVSKDRAEFYKSLF